LAQVDQADLLRPVRRLRHLAVRVLQREPYVALAGLRPARAEHRAGQRRPAQQCPQRLFEQLRPQRRELRRLDLEPLDQGRRRGQRGDVGDEAGCARTSARTAPTCELR